MRKNVLKVFAACAAVCFVSGLVLFNNGADTAKANQGEVICNYTFEDGNYEGIIQNGSTAYTIEEGLNSTKSEGNACLKVVRGSNDDWWERAGVKFDLKKLTPGVTYKVIVDVYHESDPVMNGEEEKYDDIRAFKLGTYFTTGKDGDNTTAMYGQIGSVMGAAKGVWERIEGNITTKEDVKADDAGDYFMHIFMGYPEALGSGSSVGGYQDNGVLSEPYYIDNFSIIEVIPATPTPEPTATPVPTVAPTEAPLPVPTEGPELEVGYEEAVKGITYKVTGLDTVTVVGFDMPKKKLTIPNTITLEGYAYKVTAIANNAFKGETITSLTIGSNVTTIGKNAFANCKSLKKVTIKSTVIKSIGKNAFKKTNAKATIKVPKAKKAAYKKLLKKAGIGKKVKVK